MQLKRDYFDNLETPDYVLCKANRERIGVIPCAEKTHDFNFGDMDEISLKTYYMTDGIINPIYKDIEIMKYVLVPNKGFFYIRTCNINSEGTEHEYKEVKAHSIEGLLGQKYIENFEINTGETGSKELEYDPSGKTPIHLYLSPTEKATGKKDLFDYVLEKCPDWYVAYCDPALMLDEKSHRSFSIDRKDVYGFIMNDIQESFECYVIFDTIHLDNRGRCPIYIYAQDNYQNDTDIYVSYENLLEKTSISADTDDIKTCVILEGEDELEIREVNFGYDRLYNFDYYNNTNFWSQKLYDEYNAWHDKTYTVGKIVRSSNVYTADISDNDLKKMSYLDLYKYRLKKYLEAMEELSEINNHTSSFVNDEERMIGTGKFPVFDNSGKEIGSITFDDVTGVRILESQNLPSRPISGEDDYMYIIKDATYNISNLKNELNVLQNGKVVSKEDHEPQKATLTNLIYSLQNKFYDTETYARQSLIRNLRNFERGGSVDLVFRPIVDARLLENAGWGKQNSNFITLHIATYSDEIQQFTMNFTPLALHENGQLKRVLTPSELNSYANEILQQFRINGQYDDYLKLKIGDVFYSSNDAVATAQNINQLESQYYNTGAYWDFYNKNVKYNYNGKEAIQVVNVASVEEAAINELRAINEYIGEYHSSYHFNKEEQREVESIDYQKFNEAERRRKVIESVLDQLIVWIPIPSVYYITSSVATSLINISSTFRNWLKVDSSNSSRYIVSDINQYLNHLNGLINSKNNQIQTTVSNSKVTYPGYIIYRWFDNSDMLTFYNALVRADNSYKSSGSISVSDAQILQEHDPLFRACLIIGSYVTINNIENFETFLKDDLEEYTALKNKFPSSTWFNTNDWQGYGADELNTWAMSVSQIMDAVTKKNWGVVPEDYKDEEIDEAPLSIPFKEATDESEPYNYFGHYLPTYLTQLAIEQQVSSVNIKINGYDTYPYALNSKGSIYSNKLPTTGNVRGDTYSITNDFKVDGVSYKAGTNVTWNGSKWIVTDSIKTHVKGIQDRINDQATYKAQIIAETSLDNNLSEDSRIELSLFIREQELSSENFVVTDTMTETERQEMLQSFVEYGEKELAKVSVPQLTFTANILDLFSIPEFDGISEDFEPGKRIFVSLRDDYNVKAILLNLHINYYDPTDFTMKFSDILKKSEGLYTDIQDAINTATSAATSVSIGSSSWTTGAAVASRINTTLEEGLLSQGAYLRDNPAKSTFEISDIGIFVDTASGDYGKYDVFGEERFVYDSIYMGGGRILFTDDGWKHVRMSLGRSKVKRITSDGQITNSEEFGVFADFCIAGYVAGSQICGGELFSDAFCNDNKSPITYFDLNNGTFVLRKKSTSSPIFSFNGSELVIGGYATDEELNAEKNARQTADQNEAAARLAATQANANKISQEIQDRISQDNSISKDVTAKYKYIEDNYTTEKALAQWLADDDNITKLTTINGGHITTGFISAGNAVSWIDLDHGWFNFGGGVVNKPGQSNSASTNYIAWVGGELVVKGNITANSGTFSGTIKSNAGNIGNMRIQNSSLENADGAIHFGLDGIRINSYNFANVQSGFSVDSDGHMRAGGSLIGNWNIGNGSIFGPNGGMLDFSKRAELHFGDSPYLRLGNSVMYPDPGGNSTFQINITGTSGYAASAGSAGTAGTATNASYATHATDINNGSWAAGFSSNGFIANTSMTLGDSSHKWSEVYASKGSINTSDRNLKNSIVPIEDRYEKMFFGLEPVTYKLDTGDRTHIGFISQDVYESMKESNLTDMDFAGYCYDLVKTENEDEVEVNEYYGLRYSEFIALNTHMIQKLYKRIDELEQEIERIKNA